MGKHQTANKAFSLEWRIWPICAIVILFVTGMMIGSVSAKPKTDGYSDQDLTKIELLGKYVFFDKISEPERMACVTCHDPEAGGTFGVSGVNLHQVAVTGANPHTVGNLKPPTNSYASMIAPLFTPCPFGVPGICGGNFWNGRAEGNDVAVFPGATKHIGDEIFFTTLGVDLRDDPHPVDVEDYAVYFGPTADQALNPMPNLVEQNIQRQAVCQQVAAAKYAPLYQEVWGVSIDCSADVVAVSAPDVDDPPEKAFDISFKRLMLAVCAWQASVDLNSFSSKRDKALAADSNGLFPLDGFTEQENLGHDLFYNSLPLPFAAEGIVNIGPFVVNNVRPFADLPVTNCSFCHSDNPGIPLAIPPVTGDTGEEPLQLYADDAYHNIGTPPNHEIPDTGVDSDLGLAGLTGNAADNGFFKTPTLRNVDKRPGKGFIKAYTHNGWFKSLESIVHFYNTAALDVPAPLRNSDVTQCPDDITTEKDALKNNCWPAPAYNVPGMAIGFIPGAHNQSIIGNLGLTPEQEAAIVSYLKTLTDEHTAKAPKPYK